MVDEKIKRDAYLKGLKLKNTGLDEETISIRLEKQGISSKLAKEVAKNVNLQREIDALNNEQIPAFGSGLKEWSMGRLLIEIINLFRRK